MSINNLAVGWQNVANQQSIAVGYDVSATGQRAAAFGYTANASDNGAFVFNGDNSYPAVSVYESHGVGTFNINAPLSDIYVQENTLDNILCDISTYYQKTETSSAVEIGSALEQKSKVMFVEWED